LLPGRTTTITASVTPATGFTTVWTLNGTSITPTGNTYTADVNQLGTYTVIATIGSCTSLPASIVISDSASSKLWIYPSPNTGLFTVSYYVPGASSTNRTTQKLTIHASDGKLVYSKELAISQPYQLEKVDLRRSGHGVYYVVLRDAGGKKIKTGEVVIR
ncbi:MAG TPA: T9SS type A sorting domain-containing protein, partial [Ferruginibacter sp.]|nr:T9SS type A sorting domain-containing protein [Ferruginibacter sp.]